MTGYNGGWVNGVRSRFTYSGYAHNEYGTEVELNCWVEIVAEEQTDNGDRYLLVEAEDQGSMTFEISERQMRASQHAGL